MPYKNIWLIDDDYEDVEIFMEAINSLQRDIFFSYYTDPVKAFEALTISEKLPDLLFIDINMPRLNGLDLLIKLRQHIGLRDIGVILISSPNEAVIRNLAPGSEIGKYITKPNSYSELVTQLDQIL
jgi:CheY-like chemotaxis protein